MSYPVVLVCDLQTHVLYDRKQRRKWTRHYKKLQREFTIQQPKQKKKKPAVVMNAPVGRSYPLVIYVDGHSVECPNHKVFHTKRRNLLREKVEFTVEDSKKQIIFSNLSTDNV